LANSAPSGTLGSSPYWIGADGTVDESYSGRLWSSAPWPSQRSRTATAPRGSADWPSVAKFPKKYLPKAEAMRGADAKLRSIAAEYRRMHL
jgi:hypothetical protein